MICVATGPSSCLPFGVAGSAIHDLDFSHSLVPLSAASTRCWGRFIAIKEAIEFDGKQDLRTKVMIALFAEVERDLISERTKEGLAAAKAKGKRLGRPEGA